MSRQSVKDNSEFEINFYEKLLKENPNFIEALGALGDLYTKKGFYEKGLKIDRRLSQLRPEDPYVLYNLSCSYSLLGIIDKSFSVMKLAINCGYDNLCFLQNDHDLNNLKNDQSFREYFDSIKKKTAP